jgi:hypothetical protein
MNVIHIHIMRCDKCPIFYLSPLNWSTRFWRRFLPVKYAGFRINFSWPTGNWYMSVIACHSYINGIHWEIRNLCDANPGPQKCHSSSGEVGADSEPPTPATKVRIFLNQNGSNPIRQNLVQPSHKTVLKYARVEDPNHKFVEAYFSFRAPRQASGRPMMAIPKNLTLAMGTQNVWKICTDHWFFHKLRTMA